MDSSRAVVWDLDGVLVDSGAVHDLSWREMANRYGVPYDPEVDFPRIFGKHNTDIINQLWGITDPERVAEMAEAKETAFRAGARTLKPLPGVVELVRELQARGWKQGIGSSAPMKNIDVLLEALELRDSFQSIASGDDVTAGKPDPQVFLLAFERLGVRPESGVVVEDAPAGIEGGVRAGAATLGVTTTQQRETLLAAGADRVVDSLAEVSVSDLEALIQARQARTR